MDERIGFIGVGRMGSCMATRLLEAGYRVTVFDSDPAAMAAMTARGAQAANTVAEVGGQSEIVMASLPSPVACLETAQDLVDAAGVESRVRIFVDLSTSGTAAAQAMAALLAAQGIQSIDAPVSGGVAGAAAGTLTIMASGASAAVEQARRALERLGRVFVVGERPGLGQTVKLANNLLSAAALAVSAEAMAMGVKAGVDPATMLKILNSSSGCNSATQVKIPRHVLNRRFDFGFANALSFKDVRLCLDEAEALGVPMVVGAAVRQMLSITHNLCGPAADCTELVRVIENWAGCRIGAAEEQ